MTRRARLALVSSLVLAVLGCDSPSDALEDGEKVARDASQQALDASKQKAGELADEATDASKKLADEALDASKKAVVDVTDATRSSAQALFDDLRTDGELSATATAWLKARATDGSIESVLVKGVQLTPVALEATKVLADATDRETVVEPIFQKVDEDPATLDAAIGDMPRVEVVDDVTVGFEQIDGLDASKHVEQRGYLVMWRHEDHLVGFVYRSTRTIDLDTLVKETPRLIRLTQKALQD